MTTFTATDYRVLEPGNYQAIFDRTEESVEPGPFGDYVDWYFFVITEDGPVPISGRSSKPEHLTRSTKAWAWLEALLGRPLARGEVLDTSSLMGTRVQLTLSIKATEVGEFNKIVGIRRIDGDVSLSNGPTTASIDPEYARWLAAREADKTVPVAANAEEPPSPTEVPPDLQHGAGE